MFMEGTWNSRIDIWKSQMKGKHIPTNREGKGRGGGVSQIVAVSAQARNDTLSLCG